MSHELHAVVPSGTAIDEARLINSLKLAGWTAPDGADGLVWDNPDTGVRATIEAPPPPALDKSVDALRLTLIIPYVRPSWYGRDVIESFADAMTAARIMVVDPQAGDQNPRRPDTSRLIESYEAGNAAAVVAVRDQGTDIPWFDPASSLAFWRYQRAKGQLTVTHGATVYVPGLRLVRRSGSDRVLRAMSWPDAIPALLPDCDLIILMSSGHAGGFKIRGVADGATAMRHLTKLLGSVSDSPVGVPVQVVWPERATHAGDALAAVPLAPLEGLEALTPDQVVDIPPTDP